MPRSPTIHTLCAAAAIACGAQPAAPPMPPVTTPAPVASPVSPPAPAVPGAAYEVLLAEWIGPHGGVPPWDKVETAFFAPAVDKAGALLLAEVDAIAANPDPPSFDNTLAALERAGKPLDRVTALFGVMSTSRNTPEIQDLSRTLEPKLQEIDDKINFNAKLFARVEAVYKARDKA